MDIRDEFYRGSVLDLDGFVVIALARKVRGPGSNPGPGYMGCSPDELSEELVT